MQVSVVPWDGKFWFLPLSSVVNFHYYLVHLVKHGKVLLSRVFIAFLQSCARKV